VVRDALVGCLDDEYTREEAVRALVDYVADTKMRDALSPFLDGILIQLQPRPADGSVAVDPFGGFGDQNLGLCKVVVEALANARAAREAGRSDHRYALRLLIRIFPGLVLRLSPRIRGI
jgi:hypothetical protein